jgi:RNA polymerase-interacting CarD/CdnL/TRCF family regulator
MLVPQAKTQRCRVRPALQVFKVRKVLQVLQALHQRCPVPLVLKARKVR